MTDKQYVYKLTVEYGKDEVEICHFKEKITRTELEKFISGRHKSVTKSPVDFRLMLDDIIKLIDSNQFGIVPIYIREFYDMPVRQNPVFYYTEERYNQLLEYFQIDTSEVLVYKIHRISVFENMKEFDDKY